MTIDLNSKNFKRALIIFCIYMISIIIAFTIGRNIKLKSWKDSQTKLEQDLNEAKSKMNDIEIRNQELLELNDRQQKINDELKEENELMKSDINSIKTLTKSTEQKLNEVNINTDNISEMIKALKENQKIFRNYIETVSQIMEE